MIFLILMMGIVSIMLPRIATSSIPPMDAPSFGKGAYIVGIPHHYGVWIIIAGIALLWVLSLIRAFPEWKKNIFSPAGRINEHAGQQIYLKEQFELPHDLELSAHHMRRELIRRGFHVHEQQSGNEIYFSAEKHRIARWAGMILHGGIAVCIIGLILYGSTGLREDIHVTIGEEEELLAEPIVVNMDYFKARYFEHTEHLFDFEADIAITRLEEPLTTKVRLHAGETVAVNGRLYYMVDFGQTLRDAVVELYMRGTRERTRRLRLSFGEDQKISQTPWIIRLEKFTPDFIISQGNVTSRTNEWKNPAIQVSVFSGRKLQCKQWLFQNYDQDPFFIRKSLLFMKLEQLNPGNYLTLRMIRSSWILLVWIGMVLICAGLCIRHFFAYRGIWALIEGGGHTTSVTVAGESAYEYIRFPGYFKTLVEKLQKV